MRAWRVVVAAACAAQLALVGVESLDVLGGAEVNIRQQTVCWQHGAGTIAGQRPPLLTTDKVSKVSVMPGFVFRDRGFIRYASADTGRPSWIDRFQYQVPRNGSGLSREDCHSKGYIKTVLQAIGTEQAWDGRGEIPVRMKGGSQCRPATGILQHKIDSNVITPALLFEDAASRNNLYSYPGSTVRFHFIQLTLHCRQLAAEYNILRNRGASSDGSENGNHHSGSGGSPGSTIYGALMIFCGSLVMATAFKGIDAPSNPAWVWLGAGGGFLFAAFMIIQGTVLLLTGEWFP